MPFTANIILSFNVSKVKNLSTYPQFLRPFLDAFFLLILWALPIALVHQIRDRDSVQICVDQMRKFIPHRDRPAFAAPLTRRRITAQAVHRRHASPFGQPQDLPHFILLRTAAKPIATALALYAFHDAMLLQDRNDPLQIFQRYALPLSGSGCS